MKLYPILNNEKRTIGQTGRQPLLETTISLPFYDPEKPPSGDDPEVFPKSRVCKGNGDHWIYINTVDNQN
jgi:hypothetical protein